jgi:hypothetical protein
MKEFSNPDLLKLEMFDDALFRPGNKSYETLWSRDERYLINKMNSDRIQKLEEEVSNLSND